MADNQKESDLEIFDRIHADHEPTDYNEPDMAVEAAEAAASDHTAQDGVTASPEAERPLTKQEELDLAMEAEGLRLHAELQAQNKGNVKLTDDQIDYVYGEVAKYEERQRLKASEEDNPVYDSSSVQNDVKPESDEDQEQEMERLEQLDGVERIAAGLTLLAGQTLFSGTPQEQTPPVAGNGNGKGRRNGKTISQVSSETVAKHYYKAYGKALDKAHNRLRKYEDAGRKLSVAMAGDEQGKTVIKAIDKMANKHEMSREKVMAAIRSNDDSIIPMKDLKSLRDKMSDLTKNNEQIRKLSQNVDNSLQAVVGSVADVRKHARRISARNNPDVVFDSKKVQQVTEGINKALEGLQNKQLLPSNIDLGSLFQKMGSAIAATVGGRKQKHEAPSPV